MKNDSKKQARAEQVRRDDERFRSLADTAPAMLWVTEPDGAVSFLSRAWYEFTGQTEAAALGDGWLDAVHPDDRAATDSAFCRRPTPTHLPFASSIACAAMTARIVGRSTPGGRVSAPAESSWLRRLGHRHHRAQANRARGAPRPRAARAPERYRAGADLLRRRGPLLRHVQCGVLEVVRVVARGNRRSSDARRARCRRLAHRRPAHREGVRGRAVGVRSRGRLSPRRQALDPCALYAASRRRRRHRRRRVPRHGHHGAQASRRTRALGSPRSSIRPTTRSSARASTASSRPGTAARPSLFGYSAEEAVGQPVMMLIPEERRHEEEKILAAHPQWRIGRAL